MIPLLFPVQSSAEIKIDKKPAEVEYKTFDPENMPEGMPPLEEGMKAVTWTEFGCAAGLSVQMTQRVTPTDKSYITYRVQKVTTTLTLKIVVWLPEGADDKLRDHEEGHRAIAERAYEGAEAAARAAAGKVDGKAVGGDGANLNVAEKKANEGVAALNQKLVETYREAVSKPSQRAQVIYDELTDHGRKPTPDEATAIKLAWEQQAAEAKAAAKRPATKPAAAPTTKPATRPTTGPARPTTTPARPVAPATKPAARPTVAPWR